MCMWWCECFDVHGGGKCFLLTFGSLLFLWFTDILCLSWKVSCKQHRGCYESVEEMELLWTSIQMSWQSSTGRAPANLFVLSMVCR